MIILEPMRQAPLRSLRDHEEPAKGLEYRGLCGSIIRIRGAPFMPHAPQTAFARERRQNRRFLRFLGAYCYSHLFRISLWNACGIEPDFTYQTVRVRIVAPHDVVFQSSS